MIVITSVLGLLREVIIARTFGTSLEMDCFIAAFAIVSFIGLILSPQTMQTMFMPSYQDALARSSNSASIFINNIGIFLLVILIIGSLAGYALAPYIVRLIMPGFDGTQITLTKDLMRIMIPLVAIQGMVSLGHALCNAHRQFVYPLSSQALNNLLVLILLFLLPIHSVYTLAWYFIAGGILSAMVPLIAYKKLVPYRTMSRTDHSHLHALYTTWPLLILALIDQSAQLLPRSVASLLEYGDITALNYGFRLIALPVAMIAMAISSVLFPSIIEHVREAPERAIDSIRKGTALLFYCLIPISAVLCIDSKEVVHIIFSSGHFNAAAVEKTSSSLQFYALGILGFGYLMFLNRIYCAYRYYWSYVMATLSAFTILVLLSLSLIKPMGHDGIALAFSLYCYIACAILILRMGRFTYNRIISLKNVLRIFISIALASCLLWQWNTEVLWLFTIKISLFSLLYLIILWLLRDENLRYSYAHARGYITQ